MSELVDIADARPLTRGDCLRASRPCPWTTCEYHVIHVLDHRIWKWKKISADAAAEAILGLTDTCVLDVIDRLGSATLAEIGAVAHMSRERVRQIEVSGLEGVRAALSPDEVEAIVDHLASLGSVDADAYMPDGEVPVLRGRLPEGVRGERSGFSLLNALDVVCAEIDRAEARVAVARMAELIERRAR